MNPSAAPPHTGRDEAERDRLSDLPDDILLRIVGDLGLPAVVRASGLSRRWRSVPSLLPDLTIDVADFVPRRRSNLEGDGGNLMKLMQAYAGAARRLLAPSAERALTLRSVRLRFLLLSEPSCLLHTIGCAVEDMVAAEDSSNLERLEFDIWTETEIAGGGGGASIQQKALFRRRLMSFLDACPVAFGWLTSLTLQNLCFGPSDVPRLLRSCARMQLLSLSHCNFGMAGCSSIVEVDAPPHSGLEALEIRFCCFRRVELVHAPKLRRFHCDTWYGGDAPVQFGNVPRLRNVTLACNVHFSYTPFALSKLMSSAAAANLSTLDLDFRDGKIWIQPEEPIKLPFANLRDVYLYNIFGICHLNWTLFVLEAAPSLKNLYIMRSWHQCGRNRFFPNPLATIIKWRESDFEHHSLQLLEIVGFDAERYPIEEYIRVVMEHAVCLKRIRLLEQDLCSGCGFEPSRRLCYRSQHTDRWAYPSTESEKHETRSRLMQRSSSPVKIVIG